ncbi:MAG: DUF2934 domain-containing protein [Bdellovibrionota bacterium]
MRSKKTQSVRTRRPSIQESSSTPPDGVPSQEEIARLAYELFEKRGHGDGFDLDDWLKAERQLKTRVVNHAVS